MAVSNLEHTNATSAHGFHERRHNFDAYLIISILKFINYGSNCIKMCDKIKDVRVILKYFQF